ncbi:MAG: 3'-5' exoribonuclease YhaM family protein [Bacteriovoracaceae bacterium]
MSKLFVADLKPKEEVESVFLVKIFTPMEDRTGKKYFNFILTDSTGDLEARLWTYSEELEKTISKNDFVKVKGKVNLFQGRKQFVIAHIEKLSSDQVNTDDFIMKASENPDVMYGKLLGIVDELTDVYIRDLLKNILHDPEISRRLKTWQAGKSIHHAYKSGLLEHILSCSTLGINLSFHYKVNENYVVAGCILHDLCKIYELTDGINVDYTEEGKLVGHLVKGLEIVDRFSYKIKDFPHQTKMHLKHILLSHHGEYQYGSPKIPQTSEAYLVHLIDLMDSKMNSLEMVKRLDSSTGHWSGFVKHLDRVVYKADLPFYDSYQSETESVPQVKKEEKKPVPIVKPTTDPKTSLGKMLSGFKIEE